MLRVYYYSMSLSSLSGHILYLVLSLAKIFYKTIICHSSDSENVAYFQSLGLNPKYFFKTLAQREETEITFKKPNKKLVVIPFNHLK